MVNATDSRGHIVNKYFHIIPHWHKISCLSRASSSPHILLPRFMGIVVFRVHPNKKGNWELLFTFKTIYCVTAPPTDTVLQLNPYTDQPKHYDHLLVSLLPPKQICPVDAQTPLCSGLLVCWIRPHGPAFAPHMHQWLLAVHEPIAGSQLFFW